MSEHKNLADTSKPPMKRWKKLTIGVVIFAVLVGVGGPLIYKLLNPAAKTATDELNQRQAAATVPTNVTTGSTSATVGGSIDATVGGSIDATVGGSVAGSEAESATSADSTAAATTDQTTAASVTAATGAATSGLDGAWNVETTTDVKALYVGYRVDEVLAGQNVTATGRTPSVTGSLTISGTKVSTAEFTAQMATVKSDKDQRDGQFSGRIMEAAKFPTATFKLTRPIDFKTVPVGTAKITASTTGDLTLHGVTKSVTFDISGFASGNEMTIAGEIPVKFADYSIANPSFGPITTEDHGALEFLLVLKKA